MNNVNDKILDVVIVGSGPAGISAAIYAVRGGLQFVVAEANYVSGGQVLNTYEVDNYPGFHNINGFDLGMKFREHADALSVPFVNKNVAKIRQQENLWEVCCDDGTVYVCRTVIVATGATPAKLGVEGEEKLKGRGVSYCATCDGNFFKGKDVAVIGGGDTALEDAIYMARICNKVYVIHRRNEFRGAKSLEERLLAMENVEILWDTVVEEIHGENEVESISVRNKVLDMPGNIKVSGVFVAIGTTPVSKCLEGVVEMDERGYVIADENCVTNRKGIFVAGDIRKKALRQIITAASDGANALNSVISYLNTQK